MSNKKNEFAIVGMACKAPRADNYEEFWNNLKHGMSAIREIPDLRRETLEKQFRLTNHKNPSEYPLLGYLEDIDRFDSAYFKITPHEADLMDPNQRILLEVLVSSMEDAGYGGTRLSSTDTGVFVGYGDNNEYLEFVKQAEPDSIDLAVSGNIKPVIASRIAYLLDLKGPNMLIDTTCSSGLTALNVALNSLDSKECRTALVAGIKLYLDPSSIDYKIGIDSSDGNAKVFDDAADGTSWGEGAVSFVIKRLEDAIQDRDHIHAVIKAVGINQDGKSIGITAPNIKAQKELLVKTWKKAGIEPRDISYIETHGTGTKLGDPIEIDAINKAFLEFTEDKQFCAVASLKSNLGHHAHAAGLFSILKTVLCLKYKMLPPTLHLKKTNRAIDFIHSAVYINNTLSSWDSEDRPRICGVSSFGLSGTNVHAVLQEYDEADRTKEEGEHTKVFALTAKTKTSLNGLAGKFITFLGRNKKIDLDNLCHTLNIGRGYETFRLAIGFKTREELIKKLARYIDEENKTVLEGENIYYNEELIKRRIRSYMDSHTNKSNDTDALIERYRQTHKQDVLKDLIKIYITDRKISWSFLYKKEDCKIVSLPTYEFESTKHWIAYNEDSPSVGKQYELTGGKKGEVYSATEELLSEIIYEVMGTKKIDIKLNFYNYGGSSITISKIYQKLKVHYPDITLSEIFSKPTIKELATYIEKKNFSASEKKVTYETGDDDIAIVGISATLPEADNIDEFWNNLMNNKNSIVEYPEHRMEQSEQYLNYISGKRERTYKKGGYLNQIDLFEYKAFLMAPKEAELMDPAQRLFLMEAKNAIDDAGYDVEELRGSRTGVYLGYAADPRMSYFDIVHSVEPESFQMAMAPNLPALIPSRISYLFDLKGPSLMIDTACSSSLVALHIAVNGIRNKECDMAIAGGLKFYLSPVRNEEEEIGVESPEGITRTFDDSADGTVWGEGVIALILKPLKQAINDKNDVYAVIKGSAINQDGTSMGITSPNSIAQTDVIQAAWNNADITPESITYIEAHGTGTKLGDPIEIEALTRAFRIKTDKRQCCGIGSLKPNIGHLDTASGLASIVKVALALKHKKIPASINLMRPNNNIDFIHSPFYVVNENMEWESEEYPRRCGVSSFGFSGTNCHMILEEYPEKIIEKKREKRVRRPNSELQPEPCWIQIPNKTKVNNMPDILQKIASVEGVTASILEKIEKELIQEDEKFKALITVELMSAEGKKLTKTELEIAQIWGECLGISKLGVNESFYQIGGHSLAMIQVISLIKSRLKKDVSLNEFNDNDTTALLSSFLDGRTISSDTDDKYPLSRIDNENRHKPFPLSEIQKAYFMGRNPSFVLGGVATHVYIEIETAFDITRLNQALNKVIKRHPMLNAIINADRTQTILEGEREYEIQIEDLTTYSTKEKEAIIQKKSNELSKHLIPTEEPPLFEIEAVKLTEDIHHLFIGFDMLIADGTSLQIFGNEWITNYNNPEIELPELEFTFRDYMITYEEFKNSDIYQRDKKYWMEKINTFPSAPEIRLKDKIENIYNPSFQRKSITYDMDNWQRVKDICQQNAVSPSALFCTIYCEILSYWSEQVEFGINLTVFNRYPFHEQVEQIIGDFTSVMLIAVNMEETQTFFEKVKRVQNTILDALEHRHYDGVEFVRELAVAKNCYYRPLMPIVFTSMLFDNKNDCWSELGENKMGLSQTPQVFLDFQAVEIGSKLTLNWDYVKELFDDSVIDGMFQQYVSVLDYMIESEWKNNEY